MLLEGKLGDNMTNLPVDFAKKMESLLGSEYYEFVKSYEQPKTSALRVNSLKIDKQKFSSLSPFNLEPVPWAEDGFYYSHTDEPGKRPYHEAGLYYIQEPSAIAVAYLLDAQPGERVLDLCAAPGGKSTHIAAAMKNQGLLIANEIHPSRARILSQNIERMGIKNATVTNENPSNLAEQFEGFFHRILVDAPCSGEGMFRKNPIACDEWSLNNVAMCAARQMTILEDAQKMLAPGGILVYSTCTFSPEENEQVIEKFLLKYRNFDLVESTKLHPSFDRGRIEWTDNKETSINRTIRLWPHKLKGEGHFVAIMKKTVADLKYIPSPKDLLAEKGNKIIPTKEDMKYYLDFTRQYLNVRLEDNLVKFGQQLYILPSRNLPSLDGLKILRPGLHLGTFMKKRFEPSHALALFLGANHVKQYISFDASSPSIKAYLKGETIRVSQDYKGWVLVMVDDYSLGWAKASNGMLKNHYPKGLRWP